MATVTYGGKTYRGWIQISTGMTGSVSAPGQLTQPNMTVWFGVGRALVTGSMMLDLSYYPATVVKLRQGIEPNIAPFYIDSPPGEGVPYDSYPGKTIADEGCLLTSLSMALNSTGISLYPLHLWRARQCAKQPAKSQCLHREHWELRCELQHQCVKHNQ